MSVALQDSGGTRATRLSVLVTSGEAEEIAHRAETAGLSVSAYLRAMALGDGASKEEQEAMRIIDRVLDEMIATVDQANTSLEAALDGMEKHRAGAA